jgi:hypothetical protein
MDHLAQISFLVVAIHHQLWLAYAVGIMLKALDKPSRLNG